MAPHDDCNGFWSGQACQSEKFLPHRQHSESRSVDAGRPGAGHPAQSVGTTSCALQAVLPHYVIPAHLSKDPETTSRLGFALTAAASRFHLDPLVIPYSTPRSGRAGLKSQTLIRTIRIFLPYAAAAIECRKQTPSSEIGCRVSRRTKWQGGLRAPHNQVDIYRS